MNQEIKKLLEQAVKILQQEQKLPLDLMVDIQVERARDPEHGDFASNLALMLAKPAKQAPKKLAEMLISVLPEVGFLKKIEIAGPGFINFFLNADTVSQVVAQVLQQGEAYGSSNFGAGKKVLLEFVSVNPTGPLHVGHGRGAAIGSTLANILEFAGFKVHREYYLNDAGRQIDILATSVWLRYLQLLKLPIVFPKNGYQGDYINNIAIELHEQYSTKFIADIAAVMQDVPLDMQDDATGDKEAHIDGLIKNAKLLLSDASYRVVVDFTLERIVGDIREDLEDFKVTFDRWFSEKSLVDSGALQHCIDTLKAKNLVYEKNGAWWFKAEQFGDDKDRVLVRSNGQSTYFAADVAYHLNKIERGFDTIINIVGSDHHGYMPRIRAAVKALSDAKIDLVVIFVQFAILFRGNEKVQMSTRSGSFVTLRELREEVGNDSTRLFYVWRKSDQHMDFDLELAKSQSNENPLFYIQYAHARVCSVFEKLDVKNFNFSKDIGLQSLEFLVEPHERQAMVLLARFPEVIKFAAKHNEPHVLAHYLRELANALHGYYNATQILVDDINLRNARLALAAAIRQVLYNGLKLLGVSAPQSM